MRKLISLAVLVLLLSCNFSRDNKYISQVTSLPSFNMLLTDSVTLLDSDDFPGGKSIMMIYFGPECPHCQLETQRLIANIDQLKNSRIYFLTMAGIVAARKYAHDFHLDQYPEIITVGKDNKLTFARIFQPKSIPFVAIYNEQKRLVKIYHGEVEVNNLIAALR